MAKKIQLYDEYGNDRYPITTTDCVVDADGNVLSDVIDTIREDARMGATAIQKANLVSDIVVAKADGLVDDSGFVYLLPSSVNGEEDSIIATRNHLKKINGEEIYGDGNITTGTITEVKMNGASKGTSGVVDLGTVITAHQDISGKADKSSLAGVATSGSYNDLKDKPTIPAEQVNADWNATSGKAQILNKPTIPSAVTESTVSGWGFTKNTGTYSKPSTGIPKSDLAYAVQTSLGKADTALQSYTEQYKGTVTGVKINNSTKSPSNGVVDLGTVITSHQNIKTINNTTITGSGNVSVGTVTGVKVNGTTKSPTSGTVDIGNVVTSIKINGSTKTPSSGIVDLGTISGGGSSGPYVLDLQSLVTSLEAIGGIEGVYVGSITAQKMSEIITAANNDNLVIKSVVCQYHNYDIMDMSDDDNEIVQINVNGNPNGYAAYSEFILISLNVTTSEVQLMLARSPISGKLIEYMDDSLSSQLKPNTYRIITDEAPSYIDVWIPSFSYTPSFMEEYFCEFTIPTSGATVYLPEDVKWANDETPVFKNGYTYQISIVNGLGIVAEFKKPNIITFKVASIEYQAEEGMTWGEFVSSKYNDGSIITLNGAIYLKDSVAAIIAPGMISVSAKDVIQNGVAYTVLAGGGV